MKIFQTNRTEQEISKVIFPNGFYLMHFESMHSHLLFGFSTECASINRAREDGRLGRAGDPLRRAIGIGIPK